MPEDMSRNEGQIAWLGRVLGIQAGAQTAPAPSKKDLTTRLAKLRDAMVEKGALQDFGAELRSVIGAVQGDDPKAPGLVEALEGKVAAFRKASAAEEAAATIRGAGLGKLGVVAVAKLKLQLRDLESSFELAGGNLEAACRAMLDTEAFKNDPNAKAPETLAAIARISEVVPPVGPVVTEVLLALDDVANAKTPEDKKKGMDRALAALDGYKAKLDAVPILKTMEKSAAGNFAIHSELTGAMAKLAAGLRV